MTLSTILIASALLSLSRANGAAAVQIPYTPTPLFLSSDGTTAYHFSNTASQSLLVTLDVSNRLDAHGGAVSSESVPFNRNQTQTWIPVADENGISIIVGNCQDAEDTTSIWRMDYNSSGSGAKWEERTIIGGDTGRPVNFLSAGFSYSTSTTTSEAGVYVFGGMCPSESSNTTSWTSTAAYSNTMLRAIPKSASEYNLSGMQSPPVAEAGLTITALSPILSNSSTGAVSQDQTFVLLGGHTKSAFINMSQVAVYSLPEGAWAFKGVNQPSSAQGELVRRDETVEPRSGHSAVLSEDGTQIVVLGGWVGDITNPASPQLVILELGDQYGTSDTWSWKIPSQDGSPFISGNGIYGHGATVLPGGVMMVAGGMSISSSKAKRDVEQYYFYNMTSSSWISSYTSPGETRANQHNAQKHSSSKAGLGAGLGVGLTAVIVIAVLGFLLARRRKQKRLETERRLRAMALGSGRFQSGSQLSGVGPYSEMRSASWGNAQERQMEHFGQAVPWPLTGTTEERDGLKPAHDAERTGLDLHAPSPTRGLRRNLHSRGPAGFGNHFGAIPVGSGSVFRIDEEEEDRSLKSPRPPTSQSRHSDPFKDPPNLEAVDSAAEQRKQEVKGWVEDWQTAAISLSRTPSQARTYSNLSQAHSSSQSDSDRGRMSPDKSDRTNSNLSERSNYSDQSTRSQPAIARTLSQRSVSAGYALFAGAAAAMGRLGGGTKEELGRSSSKRSISMSSAHRYGRSFQANSQSLLRDESPTKSDHGMFYTPPESPIKDYKNHARASDLRARGRTRGVLGSMKRVFTGTSQVDVDAKVEHYEEKEKEAQEEASEMTETTPNVPAIPFWQGKRGARDWETEAPSSAMSSTIRRRSGGRTDEHFNRDDYDGEDWDVETAIQRRVVQVMFTVPKEKLRVVNADALSLISRSDVGDRDEEPDSDFKRMSSVKE